MPESLIIPAPATEPAKASFEKEVIPEKKRDFESLSLIQPKLTVGAPDDPYEKEADAVADKVMRMPANESIQRKTPGDEEEIRTKTQDHLVQLKCSECEKEESEKVQRKEAEKKIQAQPSEPIVQLKCEECEKEDKLQKKSIHETFGDNHIARKISVEDPDGMIPNPGGTGVAQTNGQTVFDYINELCSDADWMMQDGRIELLDTSFCFPSEEQEDGTFKSPSALSAHPVSCECLCEMSMDPLDDIVIRINDNEEGTGSTNDHPGGTTINVPSPNAKESKVMGASGTMVDSPPFIILAHELCGHHWLSKHGNDDENMMNDMRGGHDPTINRENEMRAEHGIDQRGTFRDPCCGLGDNSAEGMKGTTHPCGKKFEEGLTKHRRYAYECKHWRDEYNKLNNTSFGVEDAIPVMENEKLPAQWRIEVYFKKDAPQSWLTLDQSLTEEGKTNLGTVEGLLIKHPDWQTQLSGNASTDKPANDPEYNTKLAKRRVIAIRDELLTHGLSDDRLVTFDSDCETIQEGVHNCGDTIAEPKSNELDRNVEVKIFPPEQKLANDAAERARNTTDEPFIQRKCAHCEEEEEKKEKKQIQPKSFIQTKTESAPAVSDSLSQSIESSKGGGSSMDESTQHFMSERFDADFTDVKIHTNSEAVQMNKQLNAKAFTTGNDIYFNESQYQPHSIEGKTLLAHELTHVVQQNNNYLQTKKIQLKPGPKDQKADQPIKYSDVIPINQRHWKEFGLKYINLFKYKGYTPFETPNAFANEIFKLQKIIIAVTPAAQLKKIPIEADGIFGLSTINYLTDFGSESSTDPDSRSFFIGQGIDAEILDRFAKVASNNIPVEPLISVDFTGHEIFKLINGNKTILLSKGDQNGAVWILQEALLRLNYNIGKKGPDGTFGDDTYKALKAYQKEAGLPKWEADGMFGYKTLRLLDKRMSVISKEFIVSKPGGNVLLFELPVTKVMNRREKLIHAIQHIFKVTEKQALELIDTKDENVRWDWLQDSFKETTEGDLNRGYEYVSVPVKDYEKIATIFKSKHAGYGEPLEPRLKEAIADVEPYGKIYKLTKEIEELKSKKRKGIILNIATGLGALTTASYDALISAKEKEKADELARLGITEDIYSTKTREFQKLFASYAVKVAFQMLDDNEREASLEMIKFQKSTDPDALDQGKDLKTVFSHLNDVWNRAEKEWWQGVSVAQGAGPDEIYSYSSLNTYLKEKKGQRKHCFKGECTEPADSVLPSYENTKFKKREGNSYFIKAFDSNAEAFEYLKLKAETYPVLAYPKLELRNNISKFKDLSPEDIEAKLFATGESVRSNIKKTRQALDDSPMNVYKLKPVINMAKFQLGIFPDTIHDNLVNDAIKEYEDAEFWRNIGLAALGIGLGLLALVSGPVGWAALAAGIAVGSVDAYFQYQDITFMRTAANTAFDPSKALSDVEPGYFWFYVSLVFIGLDVFQGLKTIAAVAKAAKATEEGAALAEKLIAALKKDKDELLELIKQGGDDVAKLTEQLKKLNAAISAVDAEKLAKQINVLKHLHDLPQAVVRLSSSLENAEVLAAFEKLASMVKKSGLSDDAYKSILKFYAGTGNDLAAELPEFIRLAEKTDLTTKPGLLQELLSNPRSQKVMLDLGENQDKMVKLWNEFKVLKDAGQATTFTEFLKGKGFATELGKTRPLTEVLGTSFSKLPTLTKNQQILRTIEPALADALLEKALPKRIEEALTRILETDIIGHSADLVRAQERMKNSLRLLGATLETPAEYQQVIRLLKNTESKMAVFEKATSLAGHEEYVALMTKYGKELAGDSKALDDFLKIGPFTDDDTFKWLLNKPSIRKLIADNPELVKALKKCASPCFPIHAEVEDIEKILKAVKDHSGKVDYSRLNQYMYLNRPRNSTVAELEKWKKAVDNLANDFEGTIKGVSMPKGTEIPLPPRFKAGGATPLKDAAKKLDVLIERGFSPKQLEDILVQAHINKLDPNEFMEQLSRATNKLGSRPLDNISGIINGLSSTNPQKFETAYYFMKRIGDYSAGTGVNMAERVFSVFDINEITKLRYSSASKLGSQAAKETGEVSVATMEMFNTLASKIDGSSEDIIRLAQKAGTEGEENLARLTSAVEKMPPGKHSIASIEAKITEAKELAKKIASAGDNMGDEIWEVTKTGDKWKVGSKFTDETGKISGSRVIAHIKGKADAIAEALLDSTGAVSPSQWAVFRKTIEKTDLPQVLKNGIIGEMWGKANVAAYKKIVGAKNVFEQVTIRIKGTEIEAVVDAVIKKDGKVLFKEFKSGGATLSAGQEKVYEKMALGLTDELEFAGEKAAQIWPDPKTFSVSKVEIVTEFVTP